GRWGRRVWVAARARREILGEDQVGLEGMAGSGYIVEQAVEGEEVDPARATGQRRILAAEAAEPAEQMGVTAQLGEVAQLGEIGLQKGEEAMGRDSITSVGSCESLNPGFPDLNDVVVGRCGRWGCS